MTVYNSDILDLINVIATSFGALITGISLAYLFISDYKKSKRISNLERVAEVLEKELLIKYQPHLWCNGSSSRETENTMNFDINNKREWCRLLEFNIISGDLILDEQNKHLPYELEPKFNNDLLADTTRRYIYAINKSEKRLKDVEYEIQIIYEDRLGNKYFVNLKGKGGSYKLTNPQFLN